LGLTAFRAGLQWVLKKSWPFQKAALSG